MPMRNRLPLARVYSQVHPIKPAQNMSHWCRSSWRMTEIGFCIFSVRGGFRLGILVSRYRPICDGLYIQPSAILFRILTFEWPCWPRSNDKKRFKWVRIESNDESQKRSKGTQRQMSSLVFKYSATPAMYPPYHPSNTTAQTVESPSTRSITRAPRTTSPRWRHLLELMLRDWDTAHQW